MDAKKIVTGAALVVCFSALWATPTRGAQDDGRVDRLTALEQRVAATQAQVDSLAGELAEVRGLVDQTVSYLESQADAGTALEKKLGEVEANGFTAGQNYRSRELLLEGLRGWIAGQQKGLPGAKPEPAETAKR